MKPPRFLGLTGSVKR
ncbi:MAG: hypothetical protein MGAcid_14120 [uncultured Acidilobus sp. MG]|jgi:hypothetical protein|nr:MAG: hypothetical protein MGAcid_14120 [uncultured Acidilobus sp. MG]